MELSKDEIIRMAREAGLEQVVSIDPKNGGIITKSLPPELLERFADLVAAHEREALAEQEKQEPVAWRIGNEICAREDWACVIPHGSFVGKGRAIPDSWVPLLYAAPVSVEAEWIETNKALAKEIIELRNQYLDKLAEAIDLSVKAEREACAKACETLETHGYPNNRELKCAAAIRARGEK